VVHALLAACIASSSNAACKTRELAPGTYKIIATDASHTAVFTATVENAATATHDTTLEPYIGDATCVKRSPIAGPMTLFPGMSHDVPWQLSTDQAFCVKIYKGAASVAFAPGTVHSAVTWQSQVTSFRSLTSSCSVHAMRLHCAPMTLTTGTYSIATAGIDHFQADIIFIGGNHRPAPDGQIETQVDLSKKAGDMHMFVSGPSCSQIYPHTKEHAGGLSQSFHDGGHETTTTIVNAGDTLCISIIGTVSLVTP
jgi:hypothetical protein